MAQKTILVCDVCSGDETPAVDSLTIHSKITGKTEEVDVCEEHQRPYPVGPMKRGPGRPRKNDSIDAKKERERAYQREYHRKRRQKTGTTKESSLYCPYCPHRVTGLKPGPGMASHIRNAHPGKTYQRLESPPLVYDGTV